MTKLDVGSVLRRLRVDERHLTLHELHEAIDGAINPTTISRMESKNQTITMEYLAILARYYGITVTEIIREAEGMAPADPAIASARRVPLLEPADLTAWQREQERAALRSKRQALIALPPASDSCFAFTQTGDSMQGESGDAFADGITLLVDPDLAPRNRDYVLAIPPDGAPMLRQLVHEGDDTYLKPLNRNYRPKLLEPGTTLAGTVFYASWRRR